MDGHIVRASRTEDAAIAAVVINFYGKPWYEAESLASEIYNLADEEQRQNFNSCLFSGAKEKLQELRTAGFLLRITTNGQQSISIELLKLMNVYELFTVVEGSDNFKDPKPSPDLLLYASKLCGIPINDVIYIGDQPVDSMAAKAAGINTVIIIGKSHYLRELKIQEVLIPSITEIHIIP